MDELVIGEKRYISSKRAAEITGYAKDYVGQLCREGRVEARLVGRSWYVLEQSVLEHRFGKEEAPEVEAVNAPEPSVEERDVTPPDMPVWNAPKYTSEPVAALPELEPKVIEPVPAAPVIEAEVSKVAVLPPLRRPINLLNRDLESRVSEITSIQAPEPMQVLEEHNENLVQSEKPRLVGEGEVEAPEIAIPMHKIDASNAQPVIVHEERAERRRKEVNVPKNAKRKGKVIESAILFAVAILAIAIMYIGTGALDGDRSGNKNNGGIIDFLGGKSFYNKQ